MSSSARAAAALPPPAAPAPSLLGDGAEEGRQRQLERTPPRSAALKNEIDAPAARRELAQAVLDAVDRGRIDPTAGLQTHAVDIDIVGPPEAANDVVLARATEPVRVHGVRRQLIDVFQFPRVLIQQQL